MLEKHEQERPYVGRQTVDVTQSRTINRHMTVWAEASMREKNTGDPTLPLGIGVSVSVDFHHLCHRDTHSYMREQHENTQQVRPTGVQQPRTEQSRA